MRYEYRLSKYDPAKRDFTGAYTGNEWTDYAEVGRVVGGIELTRAAYSVVEDAYVQTIEDLLSEAGLDRIAIQRFRAVRKVASDVMRLRKGRSVDLAMLSKLCRLSLKNRVDVAFAVPRRMYLHFGWDYYVYIGLSRPTPNAIRNAASRSLFLEKMASPYRS